jgi:flagellar hook-associated protein 2
VQSFVDAYNATQAFVRAQSVAGATLQNDSLVRSARSTLSTMLLTPAARVDDSGNATAVVDDMTTMATIGVSVKKDGTLSFDQTKFNSIYPSRMNDVRAVLSDRMTTFFGYSDRVTGTYTGEIDKRESQMVTVNGSMQIRIDDLTGRLEKQRSALLAKYAKFEAGLSRIKSVGDALTAQFTAMNKSTN